MTEKKYIVSARARTAMENELRRFPDTETGGLLLGYSDTMQGVCILEATDGGYQGTVHEPCCFQYDDAYVMHICEILSQLYTPPLDVIGIWHKHNSSSPVPFSQADENIHRQLLAGFPHPCLSILFEKEDNVANAQIRYGMRVFELDDCKHIDVSQMVEWRGGCNGNMNIDNGRT